MSDLKHTCHECGGRIGYPEHAFGQTVACPHCRKETSLGEIYPAAPIPAKPALRSRPFSPPPPPAPVASHRNTEPRTLARKPDYVVESRDYEPKNPGQWQQSKKKEGVSASDRHQSWRLTRAKKKEGVSADGVGGFLGGVLLLGFMWLFHFGYSGLNGYLQTDTDAMNLIKQSMLESFNKAPDFGKHIKILSMSLDEGPDENRTGSAVVKEGFAKQKTIRFKVKIVRSFGKDLGVEWQLVEQEEADIFGRKASKTSPQEQAELNKAKTLITQVESTDNDVRAMWNNGIAMDIGGIGQLQLIRERIVPAVRETKNSIELFRPTEPSLEAIRAAMLELVQYDFSSWISINNAAAAGNWSAASAGFDRMEVDRKTFIKKLNVAIDRIN